MTATQTTRVHVPSVPGNDSLRIVLASGRDGTGASEEMGYGAHRRREARRVLRETGHIDFTSPETGSSPVFIHRGETEHGDATTGAAWVEMFERSYGYAGQLEEESVEEMLATARHSFGPGREFENARLLADIETQIEELRPVFERRSNCSESADPLTGTRFDALCNESLWNEQSVFGEDGKTYWPDQGEAYRRAFAYYAMTQGLL